jgi:GDPmannose 4,6-dehydratase
MCIENGKLDVSGVHLKTALVTGITGQDGYFLTKLLLSKNYHVVGVVNGQRNPMLMSFVNSFPGVQLLQADLTDFSSLLQVVRDIDPDEIYNLGAISFVGLSFKQPELTANVTGLGVLRLLEAVRKGNTKKDIRIYQASSSEMFGKVRETPQSETTPFYPRSPYGVAKTFAHYTCVNYREAYEMHVSSGILFNHESEHRGYEFVTRKISSNVAKIKLGKIPGFTLGNLESSRDWGYAGDYVEAMWMMLQQDRPDDYVIATGETHSVREFLERALFYAGLQGPISKYVQYDEEMSRPSEVDLLVGNAAKAQKVLGWKPKIAFNELVELMVKNDLLLEAEKH